MGIFGQERSREAVESKVPGGDRRHSVVGKHSPYPQKGRKSPNVCGLQIFEQGLTERLFPLATYRHSGQ